jgi:hypothetical protein
LIKEKKRKRGARKKQEEVDSKREEDRGREAKVKTTQRQ